MRVIKSVITGALATSALVLTSSLAAQSAHALPPHYRIKTEVASSNSYIFKVGTPTVRPTASHHDPYFVEANVRIPLQMEGNTCPYSDIGVTFTRLNENTTRISFPLIGAILGSQYNLACAEYSQIAKTSVTFKVSMEIYGTDEVRKTFVIASSAEDQTESSVFTVIYNKRTGWKVVEGK